MSTKAMLSGLFVLFLSMGAVAQARVVGPQECGIGADDSILVRTLFRDKPDAWRRDCVDRECRESCDLVIAADAYSQILLPNSLAYPSGREAEAAQRAYRRTIRMLGRQHPERIPLACQLLARVAGAIETARNERELDATARFTTTFAALLDRPGNGCYAGVIATVPKTAAAQKALSGYSIPNCAQDMRRCQRLTREEFPP